MTTKNPLMAVRRILLGIAAVVPAVALAGGVLDSLFGKGKSDDLLPPEKAFKVRIAATGPTSISATFVPAPGYYLYRERIELSVISPAGTTLRKVVIPPGDRMNDPNFGWMEVFRAPVEVRAELDRRLSGGKLTVRASYQGCEERRGVCYPPATSEIAVDLKGG